MHSVNTIHSQLEILQNHVLSSRSTTRSSRSFANNNHRISRLLSLLPQIQIHVDSQPHPLPPETVSLLNKVFSLTIRASLDLNNYASVLTLLSKTVSTLSSPLPLSPRVFGETLFLFSSHNSNQPTKSQIGPSKIRKIWTYVLSCQSPPPTVYEANGMIAALLSIGSSSNATPSIKKSLKFFNEIKSKIGVDGYSYTLILNALAANALESESCDSDFFWNTAVSLLDELTMADDDLIDCSSLNHVYTAALKVATATNHPDRPLHLLTHAQSNKFFNPDTIFITSLISSITSTSPRPSIPLVLSLFSLAPQPTSHTYTAVLAACRKSNRPDLAIQFLDSISPTDKELTCWVFNGALAACAKSSPQLANSVFERLRRSSAKPDAVSFNILLQTSPEKVEAVLSEMDEARVAKDFFTYRAGLKNRATVVWLVSMILEDQSLTAEERENLGKIALDAVCSSSTSSNNSAMNQTLEVLKMTDHSPTHHLIRAAGSDKNVPLAVNILDELRSQSQSKSSIINQLRHPPPPLPLSEQFYTSTIIACVSNDCLGEGIKVLSKMRSDGLSGSGEAWRSIIVGCCKIPTHKPGNRRGEGGARIAEKLLTIMPNPDIQTSELVSYALATIPGGAGVQDAIRIYKTVSSSSSLRAKLLGAFGRQKNLDASKTIMNHSLRPSVRDYRDFIVQVGKAGEWEVLVDSLEGIETAITTATTTTPLNTVDIETILSSAIQCFERTNQPTPALNFYTKFLTLTSSYPSSSTFVSLLRLLANNDLGQEVVRLIEGNCKFNPEFHNNNGDNNDETPTHSVLVFVGGITALHRNGLYESADILFALALANNHFSWSTIEEENTGRIILDLHTMNIAVANAAVRATLYDIQKKAARNSNLLPAPEIILVSGKGIHSKKKLKPILRPEIQRMMMEEFFPPLSTTTMVGNTGAILVEKSDVVKWLEYNKEKKEEHIRNVGAVLMNLSSRALSRSIVKAILDPS